MAENQSTVPAVVEGLEKARYQVGFANGLEEARYQVLLLAQERPDLTPVLHALAKTLAELQSK